IPKPTIWTEPDSVIIKGLSVAIFCLGTQEVQKYYLYKKGSLQPLKIQPLLEHGSKVNFSIPFITEYHAGLYYCCHYSPSGMSECSDILELVVTGFYSKPNISALPSSLVTSGGNVTLQCNSHQGYGRYILTKEGEQNVSWTQDSQKQPNGHFMAFFPMGPVTSKHRWAFRCYGYSERTSLMWSMPSETLQLLLSGIIYRKPSLLALPASVVKSGGTVTLKCSSEIVFDTFILVLHKMRLRADPLYLVGEPYDGGIQANISLAPVMPVHTGTYRCYGSVSHQPYEWSDPSDSLDLKTTGEIYRKPSLLALPAPPIKSGENTPFQCASWERYNGFVLTKEGTAHPLLYLRSVLQDKLYQAKFFMRNVTFAHGGTYKCYGSEDLNPYMLSYLSNPVELVVLGRAGNECKDLAYVLHTVDIQAGSMVPYSGCHLSPGLERYLKVLFGIPVAFLLLLLFLTLLLLHCKHQEKCRKTGEWV
ncbi:Leukocyte immunoglobulin-like receptor subfamily B member 3, partial [Lemmus lemmus]